MAKNKPGFREAMRAMCFSCCGDMLDGRTDCEITDCPLYHWQPYRKKPTDFSWRENGSHLQKNRRALREAMKMVRTPDDQEDDDE